jgi:hypothetical protein
MQDRFTIANLLREHLDIPVTVTDESGPYTPGVNVWRLTRAGVPSDVYPYRGTLVVVMYAPGSVSEAAHDEWADEVRRVLLGAYPDRYRPTWFAGAATTLIEDSETAYSAWRADENASRARLGFCPLHELGK